jgi:hypothetical protein
MFEYFKENQLPECEAVQDLPDIFHDPARYDDAEQPANDDEEVEDEPETLF